MTIDTVDYIGVGLFIGGILAVYEFYHRLKKGIKTTGVVIENKDDWSFSGNTLKKQYTPFIRIKINNKIKELKLNSSTNIPIYKVGEKVKVVYYLGKISTAGESWIILYVLIMMVGIVILLLNNL